MIGKLNIDLRQTQHQKMENSIKIGNHYYDLNSEHFSLKWEDALFYINELSKLQMFPNLKSAGFSGSNLNNEGLAYVSNCTGIENLNVQETNITNEGIKYLKKLNKLKHLRLKGNPQLTNECISYLTEIESLQDLQIHETSINYEGLKKVSVMKNLKDIVVDVWNDNYTYENLIELSAKLSNCTILVKEKGSFYNGKFEGEWAD